MKDVKEIDFLRLAAMVKIKNDDDIGTDSAIFLTGFITGLTWALGKLETEKALFEGVDEVIEQIRNYPELTEEAPADADLYVQLQKIRDVLLNNAETENDEIA